MTCYCVCTLKQQILSSISCISVIVCFKLSSQNVNDTINYRLVTYN